MNKPVKLKDIVENMGSQLDDTYAYLNKTTGEIVFVTQKELSAAEEEDFDDLPPWYQENECAAVDIVENNENYAELPTEYDINEYKMMEDFCFSMKDRSMQNALLKSIKGKGAFRRFRAQIETFGILDQWYSYREDCLNQIAKEWCEYHDVDFIE